MSRSLLWIRIFQIFFDGLFLWGSFMMAYFLRVGFIFSSDVEFLPYAMVSLPAAAIWILILMLTRYYKIPPMGIWKSLIVLLLGGACATGFLLAAYFFNVGGFFSRLMNLYAVLIGIVALLFTDGLFRSYATRMKRNKKNLHQTLIIGANRIAERVIERIARDPFAAHEVVGVLDPYGIHKNINGSQILGKLNKFESLCEEKKVTSIIQCDGFEHTISMISYCDANNIQFQFVPSLRGIFEENLRIRETGGIQMISFVQRDFKGKKKKMYWWVDAILYHVFDIA